MKAATPARVAPGRLRRGRPPAQALAPITVTQKYHGRCIYIYHLEKKIRGLHPRCAAGRAREPSIRAPALSLSDSVRVAKRSILLELCSGLKRLSAAGVRAGLHLSHFSAIRSRLAAASCALAWCYRDTTARQVLPVSLRRRSEGLARA